MEPKKKECGKAHDQQKETVVALTVHFTLSQLAALSKAAVGPYVGA
jgi:hypothetical protein